MKEKIVKKVDATATLRNLNIGESIKLSKRLNYNTVKSATRRLKIHEGYAFNMSQDEAYYIITRKEPSNDNRTAESVDALQIAQEAGSPN